MAFLPYGRASRWAASPPVPISSNQRSNAATTRFKDLLNARKLDTWKQCLLNKNRFFILNVGPAAPPNPCPFIAPVPCRRPACCSRWLWPRCCSCSCSPCPPRRRSRARPPWRPSPAALTASAPLPSCRRNSRVAACGSAPSASTAPRSAMTVSRPSWRPPAMSRWRNAP